MLQPLSPLLLPAVAPVPLLRAPTSNIACTAAGAEGLLSSPELWAVGTTALLCTVFATFEAGVELLEESVPKYVRPSIEAILREMATLGFIGLLVQTDVLGLEKGVIAGLSERYLGESELCFELFEYIHQLLFQTAIAYFLASGLLVAGVVRRIDGNFAAFDVDGDGLLTPAELSGAVDVMDRVASPLGEALLASERGFVSAADVAEYRERGGITTDDLRDIASERIEELVELDPLTIFTLTATFGTQGLALDLQREGGIFNVAAGDYAAVAPNSVVLGVALLAFCYYGYSPRSVGIGNQLFGRRFVLSSIKVINFCAAFSLLSVAELVPKDAAAILAGAPSQAVVTESASIAVGIAVSLAVLVRLDEILYQFIGCAGRARLEAAGGE